MTVDISDERNVRIDKIKQLREQGINPYPANVKRTHSNQEALDRFDEFSREETPVSLVGRLRLLRRHGGSTFARIEDGSSQIQLFFSKKILGDDLYKTLKLVDMGDFISATGVLFTTKTGEQTLEVRSYDLIVKAIRPLPEKWHGLKDTEERFRHRYLDMIMNQEVKNRFIARSKIITAMRNFFDERGFLEVETPTLQPVYGGGFARPFVTHHNQLDYDFFLRISDEMYLKRLLVGGFEKVYEINKVFRNEGVDFDHNPEFTMWEAQVAYEDFNYGMDIVEELYEHVTKEVLGKTKFKFGEHTIEMKRPWKRYSMVEAVKKLGKLDADKWKDLEQAKKAIKKAKVGKSKWDELDNMQSLGEAIAFAFEEAVEDQLIQPTIIYDYPVEVSPLAKKSEDPRFTQRFEFFAIGSELGNNYTELNDPIDLQQRFVEEKKKEKAGFDEAHQTDDDYLRAIEHGFPPACGLGGGVDRLAILLTNAASIKEVIAFPTMKPKHED